VKSPDLRKRPRRFAPLDGFQFHGTNDALVLCYHAVSETWPAKIAVTPDQLEKQLTLLIQRGYRGATFTEAATVPADGRLLAVTFDDAFRSVVKYAFPILSQLGLPGTVFVPTGFAGREVAMAWPGIDEWIGGAHESELIPMQWHELRLLAEAGWEIGSHTRSHPRLPELDDAHLAEELEGSKGDCEERLGKACRSLAYPFGDVDARVARAADAAGYEAAGPLLRGAATLRGSGLPVRIRWPRVGIYLDDTLSRYRLKVSPVLRRLRTSWMWPGARNKRGPVPRAH
jgi:peptidoglycan/xylan/chitin deacetylase (PgdA/CDA1 family)